MHRRPGRTGPARALQHRDPRRRARAGGRRSDGHQRPVQGDRRAVALGQRAGAAAGTRRHAVHAAASLPAGGQSAAGAVLSAGQHGVQQRGDRIGHWSARASRGSSRASTRPTTGSSCCRLRAQQRLGFARVLLQSPAFLFMEEATDAFDPKGERLMLEMLRHERPDMAMLTISFHPGLEPLHDRKIVLNRLSAKPQLPGLETRRQPAPLDALAEAPGRRGLGAVAPEEPAPIVLEGEQLRSTVSAQRHRVLEFIEAFERMVVGPGRP